MKKEFKKTWSDDGLGNSTEILSGREEVVASSVFIHNDTSWREFIGLTWSLHRVATAYLYFKEKCWILILFKMFKKEILSSMINRSLVLVNTLNVWKTIIKISYFISNSELKCVSLNFTNINTHHKYTRALQQHTETWKDAIGNISGYKARSIKGEWFT